MENVCLLIIPIIDSFWKFLKNQKPPVLNGFIQILDHNKIKKSQHFKKKPLIIKRYLINHSRI